MNSPLMIKASNLLHIIRAFHQLSITLGAIIICQLIPIISIKEAKSSRSPLLLLQNLRLKSSYRETNLALVR